MVATNNTFASNVLREHFLLRVSMNFMKPVLVSSKISIFSAFIIANNLPVATKNDKNNETSPGFIKSLNVYAFMAELNNKKERGINPLSLTSSVLRCSRQFQPNLYELT